MINSFCVRVIKYWKNGLRVINYWERKIAENQLINFYNFEVGKDRLIWIWLYDKFLIKVKEHAKR